LNNLKIIFGAPGCGKTRYLMDVLEKELKENDPNKIAFVSFTRKGTYEGLNRAMVKFNYKEEDLPYFRTLHSIAFRQGNFSKYDIISKKDYKQFSESMDMNFLGYYTEEFYNNDDKYLFMQILERNNKEMFEKYLPQINQTILENVKYNYNRFKEYANVVDFTDIVERFIIVNKSLPVDIAIIDEAQDLTTLQWQMANTAFRHCKKVYIAGDDDQAIYEWSGADIGHFLSLQGERTILNQSYRLQKEILEFSKNISRNIETRVDKEFNPIDDKGKIFFYNSIDDLEIKEKETYYFLSRNNYFLYYFREFLRKKVKIFTEKDKLSYNKQEISAINIFEKMRKENLGEMELAKIKQYLNPNIDLRLPWYDNLNLENDTIAYYKDLIKEKTDLNNRDIVINTIHGVKGGEADNVVLLLDFTKAVKENYENNPDSELRCLYVACTRAKKNLHIIHSQTKNGYDYYLRMEKE
jgi:superfamily I DNA/RNA helicase